MKSYLVKKKYQILIFFCIIFVISCSKEITNLNYKGNLHINLPLTNSNGIINDANLVKINIFFENEIYPFESEITADTLRLTIDKLPCRLCKINIELYKNDSLVVSNFAHGRIIEGLNNRIDCRFNTNCTKPILIIDWKSNSWIDTENLYNISIDENCHFLRKYDLANTEELKNQYYENEMEFFYQFYVNWDILDTNMVPLVHYSFGDYRNPVTTCHTAFGFYSSYLNSGDSLHYEGFINNVEWLYNNLDEDYYLHYTFEWCHLPEIILETGWISAMAQGEALAVFAMAYKLTGKQKYLNTADGIFKTLYSNNDSYWSIYVDSEDYYWLEEYPNEDRCHVLNGMLFGLWDYYVISNNNFALGLFESGLKTIIDHYPLWNIKNENGSIYCTHYQNKTAYHQIHLNQLEIYSDFFSIPEFEDAYDCFTQQ